MLHGLWHLTWLETKIFVREPLGVIATVGMPVVLFVVLGRMAGPQRVQASPEGSRFAADLPIFGAMLIATGAALSLIAIMAIYREGGILKRLRATPLHPFTILAAHVLTKLLFTAITLAVMVLAGRRYYPVGADVPIASFTVALLVTTVAVLSIGFLIASLVPTARFAQPVGTLILYPLLGLSGLFVPIDSLPSTLRMAARAQPFTYAVSLLRGIWQGESWTSHGADLAVLALTFLICATASARVFRWE
jgi:ABC-2 type transport system permease protein